IQATIRKARAHAEAQDKLHPSRRTPQPGLEPQRSPIKTSLSLCIEREGRRALARLSATGVLGFRRCLGRLLFLGLRLLRCASGALAFLDQLLDLLTALAADLLVEVGAASCLHAVSALFADLLVEFGSALGFDRLAPLPTDFLVKRTAALRFNGRPALAADR